MVCPTRRSGADAGAAATIDAVYDAFSLTLPANVTGHPSISLPHLMGSDNGDLGLQIVGPTLSDARLLGFGERLSRKKS